MRNIINISLIILFVFLCSCKNMISLGNKVDTDSVEVGNGYDTKVDLLAECDGDCLDDDKINILDETPFFILSGLNVDPGYWAFDYFESSTSPKRIRAVKCSSGEYQLHIYVNSGEGYKVYYFNSAENATPPIYNTYIDLPEGLVEIEIKGILSERAILYLDSDKTFDPYDYCFTNFTKLSSSSLIVDLDMIIDKNSTICHSGETYGGRDCKDQKPDSLVAIEERICETDGDGFNYNACIIQSCMSGFDLVNNQCLLTSTGYRDGQIKPDENYPSWFKYHSGGPFYMCGLGGDSNENFLYRGARNADGTRSGGNQLASINRIAWKGANALQLRMIRSHGGDGGSAENPFVGSDPANGVDQDIIDQWETWFTAMESAGINIYIYFYDDGVNIPGSLGWPFSGGSLHAGELNFINTIVNKFEHHKNLIWGVIENAEQMSYFESNWKEHVVAISQAIRRADNHDHPIAVHEHINSHDDIYFGAASAIDMYAVQRDDIDECTVYSTIKWLWDRASGNYNVSLSESNNWGWGTDARQKSWSAAMAGGYVFQHDWDIEFVSPSSLAMCGDLVSFFESTNFNEMIPDDNLVAKYSLHVLAAPSRDSFILYSNCITRVTAERLGVSEIVGGTYSLKWIDITSGTVYTETRYIPQNYGYIFAPTSFTGPEIAVYMKRIQGVGAGM